MPFLDRFSQAPKAEKNLDFNAFVQAAVLSKGIEMMRKENRTIFSLIPSSVIHVECVLPSLVLPDFFKIFQGIWYFVLKHSESDLKSNRADKILS